MDAEFHNIFGFAEILPLDVLDISLVLLNVLFQLRISEKPPLSFLVVVLGSPLSNF